MPLYRVKFGEDWSSSFGGKQVNRNSVFRRISPDVLDRFSQSFHHMKALYMPMMEQ